MIQEIIKKYGVIPDSNVNNISYVYKTNTAEIEMYCGNIENDFKYETIQIKFKDVKELILKSPGASAIFAPTEVFIQVKNDIILFDFDPIFDIDSLEENPESLFKIKCKEVSYTVIKA